MTKLLNILVLWPARIASYFEWAGPLIARIPVGYVFMRTGWVKLNNLDAMIANFREWGIPEPEIVTPFVSGLEFFGGIALVLGLLTRIMGGGLAVTMVVAIVSAKWADVDSLETLLGFEETTYFVVFTWLAIGGAGKASFDQLIERRQRLGSH